MSAATTFVLGVVVGLAGACATDVGYPPVARIVATPGAILSNDGFQTQVVLDATSSADPIDDPEGKRPLRYQWTIENDEFRVDDGSLASSKVTVRFLGSHPATLYVTVTDEDGHESTAREQLQLTIP